MIKSKLIRLKSFTIECKRVLSITKKPSKDEFKAIVKASSIGMALIGAIGFIIHMIKVLIFK